MTVETLVTTPELSGQYLDTLADDTPMIRAATRAGFTMEGTLRGSAWVNGSFADEVILGLLAIEWSTR